MAEGNNKFINTWEDLGIDHHDWQTNPPEFCKRVYQKAKELEAELTKANSLMSMEEQFKAAAYKNVEAVAEAEEFIDLLNQKLAESSPEVIANIMVRLPEIAKNGHSIVRTMAMRKTRAFSKKRIHAMYVRLRKMYESYTEFYKLLYPELLKNPPIIKAISGNYGTDTPTLGVKEYIFKIDDDEYTNYYEAARKLGITIETYMDLIEYYEANPKHPVDGRKLTLIDLSH